MGRSWTGSTQELRIGPPGETVETPKSLGAFEVRRELARSPRGAVFEAWDEAHSRAVAVKLYTAAPQDAPGAIARLRRDAQAAGALGHPNLAAVLGVGEHEGHPWVATELVQGVSLAQILRSRTPWPIEHVLDAWRQLCEGLAHAHREGVLHLDLKPADVRVTPHGEVKVLDFGSWHLKSLERHSPGPAGEGLHYRAPEVLAGQRPDRRADVFAVGAIVYELVAHRKAFPGETTTDVVLAVSRCEPDLACLPTTPFSPGLERILAASLARDPEARHPSFEDVHADLVQLVRDVVPRLRDEAGAGARPEREGLIGEITVARAEDRLDDALEVARRLLALDPEDETALRTLSDIESILVEREVDEIVGRALAHAADGELDRAAALAEKVERLAPWSPRYLQLQVYLDEEKARRSADRLVAAARDHLAEGRRDEARAVAREALARLPGHAAAGRLLGDLGEVPRVPPAAGSEASPAGPERTEGAGPGRKEGAGPAAPPAPRHAEADALAALALQHFLANEHGHARQEVDRALALDPGNRRALGLQKLLRLLG
jgi:serine/threonine protein kinase